MTIFQIPWPRSFQIRHAVMAAAVLLFAQPALAEKRVALIIGNSAYQNVPPLTNPVSAAASPRHPGTGRG